MMIVENFRALRERVAASRWNAALRKPSVLAGTIAAAALLWVMSGMVIGNETEAPRGESPAGAVERMPSVRVRLIEARQHDRVLIVRGRTQAARSVALRAETEGRVVEVPVPRGAAVAEGQAVVQLAEDDRGSRLARARALLAQRRIEHQASAKLQTKGFAAETRLAEALAALRSAESSVAEISLEIEKTTIGAPFAGILDARPVEIGDFVQVGDHVATVLELDPILIVGAITEREIGSVEIGQPGKARLPSGEIVSGSVSYVSVGGQASTRSFPVELTVPNPDGTIVQNMTAELRLPLGQRMAHRVTPAILTLDDAGRVGVKTVDDENRVRFNPVDIIDDTPDGIWIAGLPRAARVITVGQEFVTSGQIVDPVPEKEDSEAIGISAPLVGAREASGAEGQEARR